jgi:hypothetical protein
MSGLADHSRGRSFDFLKESPVSVRRLNTESERSHNGAAVQSRMPVQAIRPEFVPCNWITRSTLMTYVGQSSQVASPIRDSILG